MAVQKSSMVHDTGTQVVYYVADTFAELAALLGDGWIAYAKDTNGLYTCDGSTWTIVGGGGSGLTHPQVMARGMRG